jgi:DNA-binding XRE family transcriptional regulator
VLDRLKRLRRSDQRAYESCFAAIERLAEFGHELRRPVADFLRDGIYELRLRKGRVSYRVLRPDIERALRRKKAFAADPAKHSYFGRGESIAMPKTKDALKILERITGNNEVVKAGIAAARTNIEVAQTIYDARTRAGLSQSELAALIGSRQPVIARLEDADYRGHSLTMLRRIAAALEQRLEVRFVSSRRKLRRTA